MLLENVFDILGIGIVSNAIFCNQYDVNITEDVTSNLISYLSKNVAAIHFMSNKTFITLEV